MVEMGFKQVAQEDACEVHERRISHLEIEVKKSAADRAHLEKYGDLPAPLPPPLPPAPAASAADGAPLPPAVPLQ